MGVVALWSRMGSAEVFGHEACSAIDRVLIPTILNAPLAT